VTAHGLPGPADQSDPVNLVFLNTDPRAVRQELMTLDGNRPAWAFLPRGANGCVWMDAMGYEQAAYLEPEGWVGGEVQLACATPDSPLGREYRFYVRLFRSGPHTIGGAHFELNVPGTAEHQPLSWELARRFVTDEIARLDGGAFQGGTPVFAPTNGSFRTVPGLIDGYVWQTNAGNPTFLVALGLAPPAPTTFPPVAIPATGLAAVFAPSFSYLPLQSDITNPSGAYHRTYTVEGSLKVKTLSTGVAQDALIAELHRGMLTDNHRQVREEVSQTLLPTDGAAGQSLSWVFGAGKTDYWVPQQNCAIE
jgi:hypothetical protein